MNRRLTLTTAVILVAVVTLYDVDLVFDVALPGETTEPDPAVEAAFADCYRQRDEAIHAQAFRTIDNPEVQKELITSGRAQASAECRAMHPPRNTVVDTPWRFNLVDLHPRFW